MAGVARLLLESAGEPGRRAFGVARDRRFHENEERRDGKKRCGAHNCSCPHYVLLPVVTMRPILFASVPNHIIFVFESKTMWRIVSLTGMFAKNRSVFGSKPTSRFSIPLSENQMRP